MTRPLLALLLLPPLALAAPVPKSAQKERANLDGTWELVSSESGGSKEEKKGQTWQIEGEELVTKYGGRAATNVRHALVAPKDCGVDAVDFVTRPVPGAVAGVKWVWEKTEKGMFTVDRDTLTLCLTLRGGDRPTECKPDKGLVVYTFKRVEKKKDAKK